MKILYRLLGLTAKINEKLRRESVNLIRISWAISFLLFILFIMSSHFSSEALQLSPVPEYMELSQINSKKIDLPKNIKTKGTVLPKGKFEKYKKNSDGEETIIATYIPLADEKSKTILYVKFNEVPVTYIQPAYSGILRHMDFSLKKEIQKQKELFNGYRVNTNYQLVEGEKPGNYIIWRTLKYLSLVLLFLMFITAILKYTIFQKIKHGPGKISISRLKSLKNIFLTGYFSLNSKKKYFINVPVVLSETDSSQLIFLSNIDASTYFMGSKTVDREGIWSLEIAPDKIEKSIYGNLYFGSKILPSVRIHYTDSGNNKKSKIILSFKSESDRNNFLL